MNSYGLLATTGLLTLGAIAGRAGRRWLARLRRGAVFRSPAVELTAAALSAIVGWRLCAGELSPGWFAVPLLLGWLAVPLAAVDLTHHRLPNALTYAAYPILGAALIGAALAGPGPELVLRALLGILVFGGAHLLIGLCAPRSLGAGDVKLAGSLGAVLGALGWTAMLAATILAALITVTLALTPLAGRMATDPTTAILKRGAPHGPGLLAATWLLATFPALT